MDRESRQGDIEPLNASEYAYKENTAGREILDQSTNTTLAERHKRMIGIAHRNLMTIPSHPFFLPPIPPIKRITFKPRSTPYYLAIDNPQFHVHSTFMYEVLLWYFSAFYSVDKQCQNI